jgi:small subunit ribosomal protein S3
MGQKVHPYGFRLGYIRTWKSKWYAGPKDYAAFIKEDLQIRGLIKKKLFHAGISSIEIERSGDKCRVRIFTARPGIVIGRRGAEIDKLREGVSKLTKSEIAIDIKEIKVPQIDAQLVAENIAGQLERRINFRRAMKKTMSFAMAKGALGIKIKCAGRLGGAEIAREESYHEGKLPLGTLRADVDYGFAEGHTTYGVIGIKVWVYKGDILVKKAEKEGREARERDLKALEEKIQKQAENKDKKEATKAEVKVATPSAEDTK